MNINDIISKCTDASDVTAIRHTAYLELNLDNRSGYGSMMFFPVFPGITLAYIYVNASSWPAPDLGEDTPDNKAPFIINYCVKGRCELILNNANYVYLTSNQLSLTGCYARNEYIYPSDIYEGIELFIDFKTLENNAGYITDSFDLELSTLESLYCSHNETYISETPSQMQAVFEHLWSLFSKEKQPDRHSLLEMKSSVISLFGHLLYNDTPHSSHTCTFYTESQVRIAKVAEQILTSDLEKHIPIREIADMFSVSETSLKNYFRGVYGQNISEYMRDFRMKKAAVMLSTTKRPVSYISEHVGYLNQSKFASVFKKSYGVSPLEYRRMQHLNT